LGVCHWQKASLEALLLALFNLGYPCP
jgi:hypothetical protein